MASALSLLPHSLAFRVLGTSGYLSKCILTIFLLLFVFMQNLQLFLQKTQQTEEFLLFLIIKMIFKVTVIGICHFLSSSHTDWNDLTI